MSEMTSLLAQYGLAFVFLNVFLLQVGLPLPAVPTLMAAGGLTVGGGFSLPAIIAVAVTASLAGDLVWYVAGRIYGFRVLRFLCRVSISPDSCVRDTESRFLRWGAASLIAAKFIPGFATVAPPLAGALRVALGPFLAYSALSAALWAGLAAGAGMLFHHQVDWLLGELQQMGIYALAVIGAALALFIALKWWERRRFFAALRMARISVEDLYRLIEGGHGPLVVDVRSAQERRADPRRIRGAIAADLDSLDAELAALPPDRDIIVYCT
jgi:membrane protein DedA with SNARE-associated domain